MNKDYICKAEFVSEYQDVISNGAFFRFLPKKDGGKLSIGDIINQLSFYGMSGNFYCLLFRVPEEHDGSEPEYVDIFDDYQATKILADLCHYKLTDKSTGKELNLK